MPPRYLRVCAGAVPEDWPASLPALGPRVAWLQRLRVHAHTWELAEDPRFVEANVVGIDAASAAVCEALDVKPGHAVLDLCCAPGSKLAALAELMQHRGCLVGVDVSLARLNIAKNVLKKYRVSSAREGWSIFALLQDGRLFDPLLAPGDIMWSCDMDTTFFSTKAGESRKHVGRGLRKLLQKHALATQDLPALFDRVLVDAECTTDARVHGPENPPAYKKVRERPDPLEVVELQLGLLKRGFELLKPGGVLVYATCSADARQNQGLIRQFLKEQHDALVVDTPLFEGAPVQRIELGIAFSPEVSDTSGMYLCRLTKHAQDV